VARGGGGGVAARKSRNGGKGKAKRGLNEQYFRKKVGFKYLEQSHYHVPCASKVRACRTFSSLSLALSIAVSRVYTTPGPRGGSGAGGCVPG
jgi:hypothetical protein